MKYPNARILVLCKAPTPGRVKTRLVPALTPEAAAALHAELATRLIVEIVGAHLAAVVLWCDPDCEDPFFDAFDNVERRRQYGADLGQRMANAFSESQREASGPVVLIGTDCPNLGASYVDNAIAQLDDHDAVVGPAEDGGYGLIGFNRTLPHVFEGIAWGSDSVCAETCRRLNEHGQNFALLSLLWDVDRPEDVIRYQASLGAS